MPAAWLSRLILSLAFTTKVLAVTEALQGDDECLAGQCSTELLQVNRSRSQGSPNTTTPTLPPDFVPFPDESAEPIDMYRDVNSTNSTNASHLKLKSGAAWVGCWLYGCHRGYHREFHCQCNPACYRFGNCCGDFGSKCWYMKPPSPPPNQRRRRRRNPQPAPPPPPPSPPSWSPAPSSGNIVTVFHQTSPQACKAIVHSAFRPGSDGHCGGAIYFAMSPQATKTKAIGTRSQSGCVIEAKVDVGHVKHEGPRCGHKWNEGELKQAGYDSIQFDPGDGTEVVIYDPRRVKRMHIIPYNNAWRPTYNVR